MPAARIAFDNPIVIIAMRRCGFVEEDFDPRTFYKFYTDPGQNNSHSYSLQQVNININKLNAEIANIRLHGIKEEEHALVGYAPVDVPVISHKHEKQQRTFKSAAENRYKLMLQMKDARIDTVKQKMAEQQARTDRIIERRKQEMHDLQMDLQNYTDVNATRAQIHRKMQRDRLAAKKQAMLSREREKQEFIDGQKQRFRDHISQKAQRHEELIDKHQQNKDAIEERKRQRQIEKGGSAEQLMQKTVDRAEAQKRRLQDIVRQNNDVIRQRVVDCNNMKDQKEAEFAERTKQKLLDKYDYVAAQEKIKEESIDRRTLTRKIEEHTAKMKQQRKNIQQAVVDKVNGKHQREAETLTKLQQRKDELHEIWKAENEANLNAALTMRDRFERMKMYKAQVYAMKK